MSPHDIEMLEFVKQIQRLRSLLKGQHEAEYQRTKPCSDDLFAEFFPEMIAW